MPNLFGINISQVLASSIAQAGGLRPGILQRQAASAGLDPNNPNKVMPKGQTTAHNFQGFVERRTIREQGTLVQHGVEVISILGGSIDIEPATDDKVVIDAKTYTLGDLIKVDPANAVYEFRSG